MWMLVYFFADKKAALSESKVDLEFETATASWTAAHIKINSICIADAWQEASKRAELERTARRAGLRRLNLRMR